MAVRIGFIGVGGIAQSHLVRLVQIPNADVVALCDIKPGQVEESRQAVNKNLERNGFSSRSLEGSTYTDFKAMLRNENLDAVYICVEPFSHGEIEDDIIDLGLPMLVEKPVTLSLALANRTLQRVKSRGLITAVGYQLRYSDQVQKAKELLSGKTIGMANVTRFGGTPPAPWFMKQDRSGGQLIEQATHQVDMLRYLVGEVRTVYAAADLRINTQNPEYTICDVNCMTITFVNGAVASFANNTISSHGAPPGGGVHVFADGFTVSIGGSLQVISTEGREEFPGDKDSMLKEDQAFVSAVEQGCPELILSDYHNGVRSLAVTIAGDRSARQGRPINVEDLLASEAPAAL